MRLPLVFDLETKYTFLEKKDYSQLEISVLGFYDYNKDEIKIVREDQLSQFFKAAESASYLVGFNIHRFDLRVLQPYYSGDIFSLPSFDMLSDIKQKAGKRFSLNDLVRETLGKEKSGHGLEAIRLYQEGEWSRLESYCRDDVVLTKELFEYGVRNKKIFYPTDTGREELRVDWERYLYEDSNQDISLTLPFE